MAEAQRVAASEALAAATTIVEERTEFAARAATVRVQSANALPPLREAEAERSAALQRLIHERDALDAEEARAREEAQRLRQRLAQAESDRAREQNLEHDAQQALGALEGEREGLIAAETGAEVEIAAAETRALELKDALADRERLLERLTAELADLNAQRASLERTRNDGSQGAARAARQIEALNPRIEAAQAEAAAAPDVRAAEAAVEDARTSAETARGAADSAREQHRNAADAESAARKPLEEAEREAQRINAEVNALARMLGPDDKDLWPPVIDSLRVQPGYEAALAAALGEDLDAPLDEAAPHHWRNLGALPEGIGLPAGATPLSQFVEAPPALARRLAFTGVIAADAGREAQSLLHPGQRLVSTAGDLWRWDGFRVSAEARSPAAIRLEQRNRLEALQGELETAKAARASAHETYAAAQSTAATLRDAARAAEDSLRRAEGALIAAQDHAAKAARAAAERAAKLATLETELRNANEARDEAAARERAAAEALSALPDGVQLATDLADARSVTADLRGQTSEALAALETLRRAAQGRAQRLKAIADEAARWTERRTAATQKIEELAGRMAILQTELTAVEALPEEIAGRRSALLDAMAAAEAARSAAADARAQGESVLAEADKEARAADRALAEAREERAGAEARAESAIARINELATRIREELDAEPAELAERAEIKPDSSLPPLEQAEQRVEKLKREREQLGGVNLRAEGEATEHEQRLQSLQADRADLDGAIQRLRKGIQSLNREGRERLLASFEKVNANFERLFTELFQGGEARLTFTESEDPLEAGLEILARPPGKKLTTLSLLSGGEQALTAISLIFAVFLVNPAPICVLDEVDAPLDDANVDRFCRLLEEMTRLSDTRFLIISHHALTMSRMNRLFGVTMAERGVSQLVSVSLAEAERVIAAE
jgi:chromosome segregation protein